MKRFNIQCSAFNVHCLRIFAVMLSLFLFSAHAEKRPNVLMLCIDDMNDWTGFLGGHPQAKTPNMDRLAARGVNFTNAHCPSPGCSPSRNAILLGVEPHNSGLYPFYNLNHVDPAELARFMPLPKLFKDNGYTTCGLTKVWHNPDNTWRQDEQWDEYHYYGNGKLEVIPGKGYHPEPYNKRTVSCPASNPLKDFQDYQSAMHAVRFLEKEHDKPFFLAVGIILPHTSFIMPEENWDRFSDSIEPPPFKADDLTDIPLAGQANAQIYVEIPVRRDNAWEDIRRGYLACINFTDDNVGRVLDALEKSPYADNTIIVLWSDHGFHLGEKRSFSKFSLWNEATRTPFIIVDPRGRDGNGKRCGEPVGLINVYKTLADLTGLQVPDYVDGQSLVPWLDNPALEKETPAMTTWGRGNYTLRTKEWRYTRYFDGNEELYNESDDPNEWTNLAGNPEYDSLKKKFAAQLPEEEVPQVTSGRELYNVADADKPMENINAYKRYVKEFKAAGLQPPLD
jgi:arylsulfatase A-like enzyme